MNQQTTPGESPENDSILPGAIDAELSALEQEAGSDPALVAQQERERQQIEQAEKQQQSDLQEWQNLIGEVAGPAFGLLAPNWNIQPAEIEALSSAYAALAVKYLPNVSSMGPEIGAAMVTLAIFAPRRGVPRKLEKPEGEGGAGEG